MMDIETARALIHEAIDAVNRQLPPAKRLRKTPDTVIIGPGGALDSLGIVNFVVTLEETVADRSGVEVQLLELEMIGDDSPFRTVESLARYLASRRVPSA